MVIAVPREILTDIATLVYGDDGDAKSLSRWLRTCRWVAASLPDANGLEYKQRRIEVCRLYNKCPTNNRRHSVGVCGA